MCSLKFDHGLLNLREISTDHRILGGRGSLAKEFMYLTGPLVNPLQMYHRIFIFTHSDGYI